MAAETSAKAPMTTIKVPQPLRQRIAGDAAEEGVTAAAFLAGLLDRYERDRRFAQVRRAYAGYDGGIDSDYAELTQAWDRATDQDLDTAEDLGAPLSAVAASYIPLRRTRAPPWCTVDVDSWTCAVRRRKQSFTARPA